MQEALTNVLRHASTDSAAVTVRYGAELVIEVANAGDSGDAGGRRDAAPGTGHGLVGMRERVALVGGSIEAGPIAGGGFKLVAHLPLDSVADAAPRTAPAAEAADSGAIEVPPEVRA